LLTAARNPPKYLSKLRLILPPNCTALAAIPFANRTLTRAIFCGHFRFWPLALARKALASLNALRKSAADAGDFLRAFRYRQPYGYACALLASTRRST